MLWSMAVHGTKKLASSLLMSMAVHWDESTCTAAAQNGHLETLKYAHENGCPWDPSIENDFYWCIFRGRDE